MLNRYARRYQRLIFADLSKFTRLQEPTSSEMTTQLDDDCLLAVFERLPIQDRLNAELVCKKWNSICRKSWWNCQQLDACSNEFVQKSTGHIYFPLFEVVLKKSFNYITKVNFSCTPNYSCNQTLMDDDYFYMRHSDDDFCHQKKGSSKNILCILSVCPNIEDLKLDSRVIKCNDKCLSRLFKRNKKIRSLELINYELKGSCFSHLSCQSLESLVLYSCVIGKAQFQVHGQEPSKLLSLSIRDAMINHRDILPFLTPSLTQLDLTVDIGRRQHHESSYAYLKLSDSPSILKNLTVLKLMCLFDVDDHFLQLIGLNCPELTALDVSFCNDITDNGIRNLIPLKKLRCLMIDGITLSNKVLLTLNTSLRVLVASSLKKLTSKVMLSMIKRMEVLEKLIVDIADTPECVNFIRNLVRRIETVGIDRKVPLELGISTYEFYPKDIEKIMNISCPSFLKLFDFSNHSESSFEKYLKDAS